MYDRPFRWWVQSVMPLVFDDSLSYYEVLAKLTKYIQGLTEDVGEIEKILGTIEGIEDVTQFTEFLESIKTEIGNLENLQTDTKVNLVSAINEVALKADIAYWKPPTGIPENDLSQEVKDKLNRTGEATKYIINNKELKAAPNNNSPTDLGLGTYSVPSGGIPWDTLSQDVKDRINAGGSGTGGTSDYTELINKPQIDGHTLNAGNNTSESLGLGTYSKPGTGIPESDLSAEVQEKLNTSGGIADNQQTFVASRDYEAGELVYINGVLYKTKYKILAGTNMIPGNNIETTDISAELEKINDDIDALQSGAGPDSWSLATDVSNGNYNVPTRFFEYFNAIGGENYLFIATPSDPDTRDYTIKILKRDGTVVKTENVDQPESYAQHRFTFTPTDTGEYYCTMYAEYMAYPVNLRVEIEFTQSQGMSELWSKVNEAIEIGEAVPAIQQLVNQQQIQLEGLNGVPERVENLESDVSNLESALSVLDNEIIYPINLFSGVYTGVIPPSSASGNDTTNANNSTTDFIAAENGDKIFCGYTSNTSQALTSYDPVFVTEYDANKRWLHRSTQFPAVEDANGKLIYTITQTGTKYIRITFANTMVTTSGRLFEITKNINTSSSIYYTSYFEPRIDSKRIVDLENAIIGEVDKHIIDCWGDSRTEMIAGQGTSFCDYLQTLLGDAYNVCNYGESSQSSGACTARLGSNEVFVTLTNNQIPASGEVNLTNIKCSSGNNRNLYSYSLTSYIPCMLNGVRGRLVRASISTYDNVKFIRDSDGSVVNVHSRSKAVVPDMGSKKHICVLWWGKNDFDSAGNYVVSGILDNYAKAVKYLGHDYFVILGETCSIRTSYESGNSDRVKLDKINEALEETYPNNYIDINAWLSSEDALTSVGLTATATDLEYIQKGFPCYQLMAYSENTSDATHPNEYGRQAIANKIYAWMQTKGWIN